MAKLFKWVSRLNREEKQCQVIKIHILQDWENHIIGSWFISSSRSGGIKCWFCHDLAVAAQLSARLEREKRLEGLDLQTDGWEASQRKNIGKLNID